MPRCGDSCRIRGYPHQPHQGDTRDRTPASAKKAVGGYLEALWCIANDRGPRALGNAATVADWLYLTTAPALWHRWYLQESSAHDGLRSHCGFVGARIAAIHQPALFYTLPLDRLLAVRAESDVVHHRPPPLPWVSRRHVGAAPGARTPDGRSPLARQRGRSVLTRNFRASTRPRSILERDVV